MKMEYVKPSLIVERFTLSQSIATACTAADDPSKPYGDPNQQSINTCSWNYNGDVIFADDHICKIVLADKGSFDLICYNNPNPDLVVFGS